MADELNADIVDRMISDAISELIQKQATTQGNTQTSTQDRMGDVSEVERMQKETANESSAWFGNTKRTYDEYQNESLESGRRKNLIAEQALQNAVENANLIAKRTISGFEFAENKKWNINETDFIAANALRSAVPQDAIAAAVAKAVQDAVAKADA
jgi:HD superfamily phosphohydrolase